MGDTYNSNGARVTSINGVTGAVQIGGTNLLRWTYSAESIKQKVGKYAAAGAQPHEIYDIDTPFIPGMSGAFKVNNTTARTGIFFRTPYLTGIRATYTISCIAKGHGKIALKAGKERPSVFCYIEIDSDDWKRYAHTYEVDSNFEAGFYIDRSEGEIHICGMKLEFGNTATDWSPAPEDIFYRLETIEANLGITTADKPVIVGPSIEDDMDDVYQAGGGVVLLDRIASERRWAA